MPHGFASRMHGSVFLCCKHFVNANASNAHALRQAQGRAENETRSQKSVVRRQNSGVRGVIQIHYWGSDHTYESKD